MLKINFISECQQTFHQRADKKPTSKQLRDPLLRRKYTELQFNVSKSKAISRRLKNGSIFNCHINFKAQKFNRFKTGPEETSKSLIPCCKYLAITIIYLTRI